jgi:competence protein ComEC
LFLLNFLDYFSNNFPLFFSFSLEWFHALVLFLVCLLLLSPLPNIFKSFVWVLPVWLFSFAFVEEPIPEGEFRLRLLDVGQGLSLIVETKGFRMLYDAGPSFGESLDAGSAIVLPALKASSSLFFSSKLDLVVLSHGDVDHVGGAQSVLTDFPDAKVLAYPRELYKKSKGGVPFEKHGQWQICQSGHSWSWNEVHFEVLAPQTKIDLASLSSNNRSCVLKITSHSISVLLTGDIDKSVERKLLKSASTEQLKSDILLAAHHGSNTSSSAVFLKKVLPEVVLFSAGYKHHFGHPHHKVVERINRQKGIMFNSAKEGELRFESWKAAKDETDKLAVFSFESARKERSTFWRFN